MANANEASRATKLKTGIFTVVGLLFLGSLTVYINNRPFWWRTCEPVNVTVEDATGLKMKSPVKSLGLDIGYISDIGLVKTGVSLRVCVTAPVAITAETKAYVRSEGFLGDKFLELKPVQYIGSHLVEGVEEQVTTPTPKEGGHSWNLKRSGILDLFWISDAAAADSARVDTKSVPVGEKSTDMQALMSEMKSLTTTLKESINPEEIRSTVRQLNKTLEEASKTLSPQGGLTQTAQRSLIKLEDAIEQMRDQMTRINQGQGSVGMVLNDPVYAEELKKALKALNKLLGRAAEMRLVMNLGIHELSAFQAARASVQMMLYPKPDRYYLIGVDMDPRGTYSQTTTTTEIAGTSNTVRATVLQNGGFNFSAMFGKILKDRFDVSVGLLRGDGAASLGVNLGPEEDLTQFQIKTDLYFRPKTINGTWTAQADGRIYLIYQPVSIFYLTGGVEGFRKVDGRFSGFYGAGMRFEDEDIKLLLSLL
ncbi:MAG: MCE family protein [Proteobacteria bacterium]|nr:MCE family protein [Pseudomonadota bacterium]